MKKMMLAAAVLCFAVLMTGCRGDVKTQPTSDPVDQEKTEVPEPANPEPEDPGYVESISFDITDIPEKMYYIEIYRKANTDLDFVLYARIETGLEFELPSTYTFEDPFVNKGKTYNYKCTIFDTEGLIFKKSIMNGETKNFTPSTGLGEIYNPDSPPDVTYNPDTKILSLSKPTGIAPIVDPNEYEAELSIILCRDLCHLYEFNTTEINIGNWWIPYYLTEKPILKVISPAYKRKVDNYTINYFGNSFLDTNNEIRIPHMDLLELENVENGIKATIRKTNSYYNWKNDNIYIYEDNKKLDYCFNIGLGLDNINSGNRTKELSFVLPITTQGKKYTFKFDPYNSTPREESIIADKTTTLQIDLKKYKENIKENTIICEKQDSSIKVKILKDPKDIFIGKEENTLLENGIGTYLYGINPDNSKTEIVFKYEDALNSDTEQFIIGEGLNIIQNNETLEILNQYSELEISCNYYFGVNIWGSAFGSFMIQGPTKRINWKPVTISE